MKPTIPCLWFDNQALEAAKFYSKIFKDGKILQVTHYGAFQPKRNGDVLTVRVYMNGREYMFLNGGPEFTFTEAVSFMVPCKTQKKLDKIYAKLLAGGGSEVQCGWLKDKFGLSWQVVPHELVDIMNDPDPQRVARAMGALMKMGRIEVATLRAAADG
jgi:predicted 3-demethylubiquinone-9 3-methyltransferase (glyoxalase superfamily)